MESVRIPGAATPPTVIRAAMSSRARGAGPLAHDGAIPAAAMGPSATLELQRAAGNRATSAMIQRDSAPTRLSWLESGPAVQRQGDSALPAVKPPSVKNSCSIPDQKLGERDLGYVTAKLTFGGSADFEVRLPAAPEASPAGLSGAEPGDAAGGPTPHPASSSGEVEGSLGISAKGGDTGYQAEVGIEFEKRATGLFEGITPKVKIGGEAKADSGKLGIEFSASGWSVEPKFAFNLAEVDAQEGIHFATLEAGVDVPMPSFSCQASDGATLKVTPKVTYTVAIEPNYERILQYLIEVGGEAVAAEALIAGGMIIAGAAAIVGTLATLGDGEAEAKAIDNAELARRQVVAGFVAGATRVDIAVSDDFTMEGCNRGRQWRADLQTGQGTSGIPVPANVIDTKSREHEAQIRASAMAAANQLLHDELVRRYWDIHWAMRKLPWADIDTVFMMLMEGQGFGRPAAQEGKDASGSSILSAG